MEDTAEKILIEVRNTVTNEIKKDSSNKEDLV
jgi:hypothetical protein